MKNDSEHEIISDVKLAHNGVLHRFLNPAGVPYSAIYIDGCEWFSTERENEETMIKVWNNENADLTNEED